MDRRLPPYGREVQRILNTPNELKTYSGCTPNRATVYIANGPGGWDWRFWRPRHLSIVLPYGADPFSYQWGFLHGHEPPLVVPPVAADPDTCAEVAAAILHDGVMSVVAFGGVRYTLECSV